MHRTTVVPNYQVTDRPLVFVHESVLFTVVKQKVQYLFTFCCLETNHADSHQPVDVETFPSCLVVRPYDRVVRFAKRRGPFFVTFLGGSVVVNVSGA